MHAIIGLGNPGYEYDGTRHNIGFAVIDSLSESLKVRLRISDGEYLCGTATIGDEMLVLAKPLTYMNNSGIAIRRILERYDLLVTEMLVIVDDFHLPLGAIRIRPEGSDGGHNGLASIIYHLQTKDFPRLRCGIGSEAMPKEKRAMSGFVLARFEESERPAVHAMVERTKDAAIAATAEGIDPAMARFNTKKI